MRKMDENDERQCCQREFSWARHYLTFMLFKSHHNGFGAFLDYVLSGLLLCAILSTSCQSPAAGSPQNISFGEQLKISYPQGYAGHRSMPKYQRIGESDCICMYSRSDHSIACIDIRSQKIKAEFPVYLDGKITLSRVIDYRVLDTARVLLMDYWAYAIVGSKGELIANKSVKNVENSPLHPDESVFHPYPITGSIDYNMRLQDSTIYYCISSSDINPDSLSLLAIDITNHRMKRLDIALKHNAKEYSVYASIPNLHLPLVSGESSGQLLINYHYSNTLYRVNLESMAVQPSTVDFGDLLPPSDDLGEAFSNIDNESMIGNIHEIESRGELLVLKNMPQGNVTSAKSQLYVLDQATMTIKNELEWPSLLLSNIFYIGDKPYAMQFDSEDENVFLIKEIVY